MAVVIFRLFWDIYIIEKLYKDIGNYPNFRCKIYEFFSSLKNSWYLYPELIIKPYQSESVKILCMCKKGGRIIKDPLWQNHSIDIFVDSDKSKHMG